MLAPNVDEDARAKAMSIISNIQRTLIIRNGGAVAEASNESFGVETDKATGSTKQVVVLIHGIRTWARWYTSVSEQLTDAGFEVERTNYGRFDLVRFLLPVPWFRKRAVANVSRDLRDVFDTHQDQLVSVIAHSFGTYILSRILAESPNLRFYRVIFCGGIVPNQFRPADYPDRIQWPLLNEVGTRDIWPAVAESVTWGYGATGARGLQRPRSFDRYHHGARHSAFLTAEFCRDYWVPFLRGEWPKPADAESPPSWWLDFLLTIKVKSHSNGWSAMPFSLLLRGYERSRTTGDIGTFRLNKLKEDLSRPASRPASWEKEGIRVNIPTAPP